MWDFSLQSFPARRMAELGLDAHSPLRWCLPVELAPAWPSHHTRRQGAVALPVINFGSNLTNMIELGLPPQFRSSKTWPSSPVFIGELPSGICSMVHAATLGHTFYQHRLLAVEYISKFNQPVGWYRRNAGQIERFTTTDITDLEDSKLIDSSGAPDIDLMNAIISDGDSPWSSISQEFRLDGMAPATYWALASSAATDGLANPNGMNFIQATGGWWSRGPTPKAPDYHDTDVGLPTSWGSLVFKGSLTGANRGPRGSSATMPLPMGLTVVTGAGDIGKSRLIDSLVDQNMRADRVTKLEIGEPGPTAEPFTMARLLNDLGVATSIALESSLAGPFVPGECPLFFVDSLKDLTTASSGAAMAGGLPRDLATVLQAINQVAIGLRTCVIASINPIIGEYSQQASAAYAQSLLAVCQGVISLDNQTGPLITGSISRRLPYGAFSINRSPLRVNFEV